MLPVYVSVQGQHRTGLLSFPALASDRPVRRGAAGRVALLPQRIRAARVFTGSTLRGTTVKELTSEDTAELHRYMAGYFHAEILGKLASAGIQAVEEFLVKCGITQLREYMGRYATTVGVFIYLPYEPGVESENWPLVQQCAAITHECQHVVQWNRENIGYLSKYVTSTEMRATYEAEAYRSTIELLRYLTDVEPHPGDVATLLGAYGCNNDDVKLARRILEDSYDTIRAGGITNTSSQVAIAWLQEHGYHAA